MNTKLQPLVITLLLDHKENIMNNYKVTLYRLVQERFEYAVEADNAKLALQIAQDASLNASHEELWEGRILEELQDFEVKIAR